MRAFPRREVAPMKTIVAVYRRPPPPLDSFPPPHPAEPASDQRELLEAIGVRVLVSRHVGEQATIFTPGEFRRWIRALQRRSRDHDHRARPES